MKNITVLFISSIILLSCNKGDVWTSANLTDSSLLTLISITDSTAPIIHSISATSTTGVRVTFSEDLDMQSAKTSSNYSIPGLTVTGANITGSDKSIVDLTTTSHEDINYTLTVTGVKDKAGNTVGLPNSGVFAGDVAPTIKSVSSTSNTTVVVYFSEAVELTSAETWANYVTNPVIAVTIATRDSTDYSKVTLTTPGGQAGGTPYKLTISNVTDMNANLLHPPAPDNYEYFIGTGGADGTPPWVLSATMVAPNTIEVQFSEPVALLSSQVAVNYTIKDSNNNNVVVTLATRQTDTSKVRLTIGGTFSDHLYTLSVANVQDIIGNNIMGSPKNLAAFTGSGSMPENFDDGPVIVDPLCEVFNDFAMLAKYKGRVYLGPSDGGSPGGDNSIFRLKPDGSDPEIVSFIFHGAVPPPTTTLDAGPDGEDGINHISGVTIGGVEYLAIGPSKNAGNLDYIYYTTDSGSTIDFDYIDFSGVLGLNTVGTNSMRIFNDRLYLGFSDTGGSLPYFIKLVNIVQNPVVNTDVFDLLGKDMPSIGASGTPANTATTAAIESMAVYNNDLYITSGGNNASNQDGGIVKSLNNDPGPFPGLPDWADVTPDPTILVEWYNSPPAPDDRFSIELSNLNKTIPQNKAFPQMAVFNGNLYLIRNADRGGTAEPQLWKYDGATWSLVADNGSQVTNMSNGNNTHITLVVTNGDRLYIGFDNSNITEGVEIYRTISGETDPSVETDFEKVSTSGLGDSANNWRIYHGLSISDGGTDYLWLICGRNGADISVFRTSN